VTTPVPITEFSRTDPGLPGSRCGQRWQSTATARAAQT
jgi:hypothetical protein